MIRPLLVTLVLFGLAACGGAHPEAGLVDAATPDALAVRVEVAQLKSSRSEITVRLPGEVEGREDALLASALGGLVEAVRVEEGMQVKAGAALVEVDEDLYAAQVDQAEAQLAQAKDDLARTERMGDLATEAERMGRATQVRVAEAQARIARTQLARATVRAPFDGTVGSVGVDVGEMAAPGAPVVRLVALDPVVISLSVSDRDVIVLQPGLPARVSTAANTGIREGKVSKVSPIADLSTRSFMVEVEVPNPKHDLLPGMIAQVEIDRAMPDDALAIPQDWVVTRLDGYGVFVVVDGIARWRPVTLGAVVRSTVVVREGLAADDVLVTVGQHHLVDGDRVLVGRQGVCCEEGRAVYTDSTAAAR